jgi:hypothetical protein
MTSPHQREQVDRNYDYFVRKLTGFLANHPGEFALLRDQEVVGFYPSATDADRAGKARFKDNLYSIQEVSDEPIDLGIFSHAGA